MINETMKGLRFFTSRIFFCTLFILCISVQTAFAERIKVRSIPQPLLERYPGKYACYYETQKNTGALGDLKKQGRFWKRINPEKRSMRFMKQLERYVENLAVAEKQRKKRRVRRFNRKIKQTEKKLSKLLSAMTFCEAFHPLPEPAPPERPTPEPTTTPTESPTLNPTPEPTPAPTTSPTPVPSSSGPGSLDAKITISRTDCTAPCLIHASAMNSSVPSGDTFQAEFEWNFNDPASNNVPSVTGGIYTHNITRGFVGGHVFDPGSDPSVPKDQYGFPTVDKTYTITLNLRDTSNHFDSTATQITVRKHNGQTFFVDASAGNDSWTGTLSTPNAGNTNGPWKTAKRAFEAIEIDQGARILFRRGQTFPVPSQISMAPNRNITFAAYGTGNNPEIKYTGPGTDVIMMPLIQDYYDIRFMDLTFDLNKKAVLLFGYQDMENVLFLRNHFKRPFNNAIAYSGIVPTLKYLGIVDSQISDAEEASFFYQGTGLVLLNNRVDNSKNSHFYIGHVISGVISGNLLTRWSFGRHAIRIAGEATPNYGPSRDVVISKNGVLGWVAPDYGQGGQGTRYNWMPVHLGPNDPGHQEMENILFEGNMVTHGEMLLGLGGGFKHLMIRNNLLMTPDTSGARRISFYAHVANSARANEDVRIINNTIKAGGNSPLIGIINYNNTSSRTPENHKNIQIFNNLLISLDGASPGIAVDNSQGLVSEVKSNGNMFLMAGGANPVHITAGPNSGSHTVAQWSAISGNDQNSLTGSASDTNHFEDYNGPDNNPATLDDDLRLKITHPALNKGLSQQMLFKDFFGTGRPARGANDIGYFELP